MWHSAKAGLLFAALSAALAPAASAAGDGGADAGELLETAHFLRTLNGRPIAVITERRYRVTVDGERSFRTVSETKQRVVVGGHSKKGLASKTVLTDESGRAVALEEKSFDNRAPRRIEVKVTSAGGTSKVEFVTRLPGSAERSALEAELERQSTSTSTAA